MKLWIARDPDGRLKVCNWEMNFNKKTQRWEHPMYPFGTYTLKDDIPEVTFENSPQEVELKLIEK